MSITIIVPILNEIKYVHSLIDSIILFENQDLISEIIIVDGGSVDGTLEVLEFYNASIPNFRLLNNKKKSVPTSLNMAIKFAKSKYICRLDAHCSYPTTYLGDLYQLIEKTGAVNVGGRVITQSRSTTRQARSIKGVLGSAFGIGGSSFRLGVVKETIVDTVPFGFFNRESLIGAGMFDERLDRNQDIECNGRLRALGGTIILSPTVECTYWCRETFKEFWKNNFSNGYWNILTLILTKSSGGLSWRHFVPLGFVISIITLSLGSFFDYRIQALGFLVAMSYLFVSILFYLRGKLYKTTDYVSYFFCHTGLHIGYGVGSLTAILTRFSRSR